MLTIRKRKQTNLLLSNNTAKIERKTSVRIDNRYNTRQQYVRIINRRKRRFEIQKKTHANKNISLMLAENFRCYLSLAEFDYH